MEEYDNANRTAGSSKPQRRLRPLIEPPKPHDLRKQQRLLLVLSVGGSVTATITLVLVFKGYLKGVAGIVWPFIALSGLLAFGSASSFIQFISIRRALTRGAVTLSSRGVSAGRDAYVKDNIMYKDDYIHLKSVYLQGDAAQAKPLEVVEPRRPRSFVIPRWRSFAGLVAKSLVASRFRMFSFLSLSAAVMWYFASIESALVTLLGAVLVLSDAALIAFRTSKGQYGNNDLEALEVIKFTIDKLKGGGDPGDFDRVFEDRPDKRASGATIEIPDAGVVGAR
ncbi:hypothetical protein [Paracraurococcus lichenis]|uniref:DUF4231 domain-containing protein n=1 Tax=Paracraurococcus lichenis TaxID=3064888 RepID=A0ABT9E715_9PROT|nr:hypothetical protein [Paracraurococcus sp. LOR1-02]MDO9711982.1 hypothetical protein [Paracraurococcus sp. LOR1-02]